MNDVPQDFRQHLTLREQQIADLIFAGLSNDEVARTLGMSEGTLRVHLSHINKKLKEREGGTMTTRLPMLLGLSEQEAAALYSHLATNCPSKELGAIQRKLEKLLAIYRKSKQLQEREEKE